MNILEMPSSRRWQAPNRAKTSQNQLFFLGYTESISAEIVGYGAVKAEIRAKWYKLDPEFNAKERMRNQIKKRARKDGVAETIRSAINRNGGSPFVQRELGYTIRQLCAHLERQFVRGMNWEKFNAGEIHIDHIKPKSSFDLSKHSEWVECWSLSNLRPLWARDNLKKSDKQTHLL